MTGTETSTTLSLDASTLRDRLKRLAPFMSDEETRRYLNGVYLVFDGQELKGVATNGHILCESTIPCGIVEGGPFQAILPKRGLHTLGKMLENSFGKVAMTVVAGSPHRFAFDDVDMQLTVEAVDGTYPDYLKVIPDAKIAKGRAFDKFKGEYVLAALNAFQGSPIDVFCKEEGADFAVPHLLTSEEAKGLRCVLMPMRAT